MALFCTRGTNTTPTHGEKARREELRDMKRDSVVFNTANAQGVTVDALLSQLQNACPNKEFRIRAERAMMEVERRSVIEAVTSAFETLGLEAKVSKHELKEIIFLISDPQEEEALVLSAAVG